MVPFGRTCGFENLVTSQPEGVDNERVGVPIGIGGCANEAAAAGVFGLVSEQTIEDARSDVVAAAMVRGLDETHWIHCGVIAVAFEEVCCPVEGGLSGVPGEQQPAVVGMDLADHAAVVAGSGSRRRR